MPRLPSFMAEHRDEILGLALRKFAAKAPGYDASAVSAPLAAYYDALVAALQRGQRPNDRTEAPRLAPSLGEQEHAGGLDISLVPQTFGAISDALGDVGGSLGVSFHAGDYHLFNLHIDDSISLAIQRYAEAVRRNEEYQSVKLLGSLAHELRNALSSARLAYATLRDGTVGMSSRTSDVLARALARMDDLIQQTLVAVHLEAGRAADLQVLSLARILDELESSAFPTRGIKLHVVTERPLTIRADPRLITSAIGNVLQNALKFTRAGGAVHVRATRRGEDVVVEVEDECGGLPPGDPEQLFAPFAQRAPNRSGLGLGLSITRDAMRAHGGEVSVRNLPGKGCVFTLRQPAGVDAS